jgi:ABC-type transport system involved in multi-copper enzyme maturation permease subunit
MTKGMPRGDLSRFKTILHHELLVALRSKRVRVLFVVALTLAALASLSGAHRYSLEARERAELLAAAEQEWLHQDPKAPHPANHFGRWVIKPIEPLSIFDRGIEDFVGQRIVLDAHVKTPLVGSIGEEDPLRALLGGFDLSFVVAVLFPLLVIFSAHDAICGEKERGTLRQLLSAPVSRMQLFGAKFLSLLAVVLGCFGLPTALSLAVPSALGVTFDRAEMARMVWMLCGLGLYLAFFLGVSVAISASCARSSSALASLLVVWLLCVFLIPRTAELVAATIHPSTAPLSLHRVQQRLTEELAAHRTARYRTVLGQIRAQHPEIPEDYGTMGHDGRRAAADPTWALDPTGVFIVEANARLNEHRDQALQNSSAAWRQQQSLASGLARVSPTILVMSAWSSLAETDFDHHQWFEQAVNRYFEQFGRYFNQLWARNVQQLRDFSAAPRFVYERESSAVALSRARSPLLWLFAFTAAAVAAAIVRLRGYDAR